MVSLRQWQEEAFEKWWESKRGIVSVVTGGGKTIFAIYCFDRFRDRYPSSKLLVIVPTLALLDQWVVTLECDLGLRPEQIGTYSGESRAQQPAVANVAVLNTARTLVHELTKTGTWMLVVDECHRVGSPVNAKALEGQFVATLGVSATPQREYDEGFSEYIEPALGPVIFEYDYADARRDGVIASFELHNIRFPLTHSERSEYEELSRRVRRAYARHQRQPSEESQYGIEALLRKRAGVSLSAKWRVPTAVAALERARGKAIVFHERIKAAEQISHLLNQRNRRSTTYHSRVYGPTRRGRLRQFRMGIYDTLVTCRSLDEGLNVPDASIAMLVASSRSTRQRIQRLGRVLRASNPQKTATVITLYATEAEQRQLEKEAKHLGEVARIRWFEAGRKNA
jgi:superfamily II DNA or RNA helicase